MPDLTLGSTKRLTGYLVSGSPNASPTKGLRIAELQRPRWGEEALPRSLEADQSE